MDRNAGRHLGCHTRSSRARRTFVGGCVVASLLLAMPSTAVAVARPAPGASSHPHGGHEAPGVGSVKPPVDDGFIAGDPFDTTGPMIEVRLDPAVGPYAHESVVWVDFACTDPDSGVLWCPFAARLDTTTVGSHFVAFQSIDAAGNVGSVSVGYTVILEVDPPAVGPAMLVWPLPETHAI